MTNCPRCLGQMLLEWNEYVCLQCSYILAHGSQSYVVQLYNDGVSVDEIVHLVSIPYSTAQLFLAQAGIVMSPYTIYVLHFSDGSHYTGITSRTVAIRLNEHLHNKRSYIAGKLHRLQQHGSSTEIRIGYTTETMNAADEFEAKKHATTLCKICVPGV